MNKKYKPWAMAAVAAVVALGVGVFLHRHSIVVLNPKGIIALKERRLMITAVLLSLVVVIPVFAMTFGFAWRYRETNHKARYEPNWDHNIVAETIWWTVPLILILTLSVITWRSSHELDPFRSLSSTVKPVDIQVVALDWKWLFIYPEQHIATVNYIQFPVNTPVNFEITADAPMNSFWIPQLGGQIYAMTGMSTQLHLMANQAGSYRGLSANISGKGFAGMHFTAKASSDAAYNTWLTTVKQSPTSLAMDGYTKLARPSENNPAQYFALKDRNLYDKVMMKYMLTPDEMSGAQLSDSGSRSTP